jgi:hypothetical protein
MTLQHRSQQRRVTHRLVECRTAQARRRTGTAIDMHGHRHIVGGGQRPVGSHSRIVWMHAGVHEQHLAEDANPARGQLATEPRQIGPALCFSKAPIQRLLGDLRAGHCRPADETAWRRFEPSRHIAGLVDVQERQHDVLGVHLPKQRRALGRIRGARPRRMTVHVDDRLARRRLCHRWCTERHTHRCDQGHAHGAIHGNRMLT